MRYGGMPLRQGLRELGEELAEHVAARTVPDPALHLRVARRADHSRGVRHGCVPSLACFPDGDFSVHLPLVTETLTSEELYYEETWEPTAPVTSARTWTDAFAWSVISGLIWERKLDDRSSPARGLRRRHP